MEQITQSATLTDIVTAAVATYGGENAPTLGSQWTQIGLTDILEKDPSLAKAMANVGFYGQVNINLQTGEVIIADRGTANSQNLITDSQVAIGAALDAKPVADAFALAGLAVAQAQLSQAGVSISAVYTTGHSLGGAESQIQAAMLSVATNPDGSTVLPDGVHITNVSLDAPGIAGLANTGNVTNYTSFNISAQGDLVNLAGGDNLAGTTSVSLPVGPTMWATGGLVGLGTASMLASGGIALALGGALVAIGLNNALAAHSSVVLLDGVAGTQLGNTQVSALSSLSPDQMQNMLGVSQPQYDSGGYDKNGYNRNGYNIYGVDKNGNLDPAITQNGGQTNKDTLRDGSTLTVAIAGNGAATATLNTTDGAIYTYTRDASGQLTGVTAQSSDGSVTRTTISDGAVNSVTTKTDGSYSTYSDDGAGKVTVAAFAADGSSIGSTTNADGTSSKYTSDGQGNVKTDNFAADGTKTGDNWTHADGSSGTDSFSTDGSSSGTVTNPDGTYSQYSDDGQGNVYTALFAANGTPIGDRWSSADGSSGTDTYNTDGSSSGTGKYADGTYSISTDDGQGNSRIDYYAANGTRIGDTWSTPFMSGGDTFNADGSSNGWSRNVDDGLTQYSSDGHGNTTTTTTIEGAVDSVAQTSSVTDDQGVTSSTTTTTYYDRFSGGVESGYSVKTDDGQGNVNTNSFAVDGTQTGNSWSRSDGSNGDSSTDSDGSYRHDSYDAATGESKGDSYTASTGILFKYDEISSPDGSHSLDTWSSDGSYSHDSYNAATGEFKGSSYDAASGYRSIYDDTRNANGTTEKTGEYTVGNGVWYRYDDRITANGLYIYGASDGYFTPTDNSNTGSNPSDPTNGSSPTDPSDPSDPGAGDTPADGGDYGFAGPQAVILAELNQKVGAIASADLAQGDAGAATAAEAARAQAAAIATGVSGPASTTQHAVWQQPVITWSLAGQAGTSAAPFSGYMDSSYEASVQHAFAAWAAAVPGLKFEEVADSSQSDIRLGFGDFDTADTGVIGYTSYQTLQSARMPGAIVRIENPTQNPLSQDTAGQQIYVGTDASVEQVLLHEIGHALGLAESSDPASVMYYELTANNRALDGNDIAGMQSLYGTTGASTSVDHHVSQLIQAMAAYATDTAGGIGLAPPVQDQAALQLAVH